MTIISRQDLIAEELIREHIRKRIQQNLLQNKIVESKFRKVIQKLLVEIEAGTTEPSEYTGINVLANVLEKVIPVIEIDYKMLTTSIEQRESFRNHIIHAIKNSLRPIEISTDAEDLPESFEFTIDKNFLLEKMTIDLDTQDDEEKAESIEGEFIDIAAGDDNEEDFVKIDDQNETGRNFAATTFKQVEKQIVDAYDMLADEEDQDLFYDYLLTNMLLYFDKFEDELSDELPSTTTPEYEKGKEDAVNDGDSGEESTPTEPSPDDEESPESEPDLF